MADTEFTPQHLKEIYDFAVKLAKDAGSILMQGAEARFGNSTGKHSANHISPLFALGIDPSMHRDVAAGICLLQEAGGLVTTANLPEDPATAPIAEFRLGSRLYLAIRPAGSSDKETAREGQERTVREVWKRVNHLDFSRPGAQDGPHPFHLLHPI